MGNEHENMATEPTLSPKHEGNTGLKAVIKNVDMSEEMQQESVEIASTALEKYNIEKDIAAQIKKEFDRRHGPTYVREPRAPPLRAPRS